jgi:hypothetical protein
MTHVEFEPLAPLNTNNSNNVQKLNYGELVRYLGLSYKAAEKHVFKIGCGKA